MLYGGCTVVQKTSAALLTFELRERRELGRVVAQTKRAVVRRAYPRAVVLHLPSARQPGRPLRHWSQGVDRDSLLEEFTGEGSGWPAL